LNQARHRPKFHRWRHFENRQTVLGVIFLNGGGQFLLNYLLEVKVNRDYDTGSINWLDTVSPRIGSFSAGVAG
jgi:hypothetical protein